MQGSPSMSDQTSPWGCVLRDGMIFLKLSKIARIKDTENNTFILWRIYRHYTLMKFSKFLLLSVFGPKGRSRKIKIHYEIKFQTYTLLCICLHEINLINKHSTY